MSVQPNTSGDFTANLYLGGGKKSRTVKASDGKYHIRGHTYKELVGSRRKVYNETAHHTPGGLKKKDLFYNKKTHRIVSRKKHNTAKREKRLEKKGYFTKKGVFGAIFKK